ncbi:MAG: MarR family transcriptional regulator, partial [Oscillospiraceae bacterium]|nr:MarR family transcriptional regulator [Oscillospiraceae bacterium]
ITRSSMAVHISNLMKKGYILGKGYIVRSAPYVVVIGGVTMEIYGRSFETLTRLNSGVVEMKLGGTGRNIACNLALLGMEVHLLTVYGEDMASQKLIDSCGELGIDLGHSMMVPEAATSTRLSISQPNGEYELTMYDTSIYEKVTPAFLAAQMPLLHHAQLIVIDTSIPAESIAWLVDNCRVPIFVDPSSVAGTEKLVDVVGKLHTIRANRSEVERLSGIPLTSRNNINRAADVLLARGLRRIIIGLGGDGVFAADQRGRCFLPSFPGSKVCFVGCGDAFTAAVALAQLEGTNLEHTARMGLAAASIAMESEENVNPVLCASEVKKRCAASCVKFQYPK